MHVEIKHLPPMRLAFMRHTGAYGPEGIGRLWQRFAPWCAQQGLMNPRRKMYGISQDDPATTPPDQCRYDACIEVDEAFQPGGDVAVQDFDGGHYACARFTGRAGAEVPAAWARLVDEWLPQSAYAAEFKPRIELYEEDFAMDPATGLFSCLLCIAVRPR